MLSETDSTDFVRNKNNHTPVSWCTHRWVLNKARKQEVTGHSEQLLMYSTNVSVVALIRLFAHHPDEGYGQNVGWINEQLKFWTCCFLPWNTHTRSGVAIWRGRTGKVQGNMRPGSSRDRDIRPRAGVLFWAQGKIADFLPHYNQRITGWWKLKSCTHRMRGYEILPGAMPVHTIGSVSSLFFS